MSLQQNMKYTSDAALAASRQVWLAGLGAAAVSRSWIRNEAGSTFRTLINEGSAVESRAMRLVGRELESTVRRAATVWNGTRSNVERTLRAVTAVAKQRLDQAMPKLIERSISRKASPKRKPAAAKRAAKRVTKRASSASKRTKR